MWSRANHCLISLLCPTEVGLDGHIRLKEGRERSSLKGLGWLGGFKALRTLRLLGVRRVELGAEQWPKARSGDGCRRDWEGGECWRQGFLLSWPLCIPHDETRTEQREQGSGLGVTYTQVGDMALTPTGYLFRLGNLLGPQLSHLKKGDENTCSTSRKRL